MAKRIRVTLEMYEEVMLNPRLMEERRENPIATFLYWVTSLDGIRPQQGR